MRKYFIISLLTFFSNSLTAQKPILLDNIHYIVSDSAIKAEANFYFKTFFKGRAMAQPEMNPLVLVDFISLRPDESTVNISTSDPLQNLNNDSYQGKTNQKTILSSKNPPMYGVRWVAINTRNIRKTVKSLLKAGYEFALEDFTLPTEPDINAVAMYGFDNNIFVLVERPKMKKQKTEFGIDHLQLLVNNLEDNVKFYQTVLAAEIIDKKERSTVLKVGNHRLVLSEPEALGLVREQVIERNPKKFIANINHLSFLYDEIEPAFYGAKANNYTVVMEPTLLKYNDKPTPYTFCVLLSPDNLQIDLEQEEGRTSAKKIISENKK